MECKIPPESAKVLDKVLGNNTIRSIVISTAGNLTLQTRLENSSLYTNIVLSEDFFLELEVKDRITAELQKVKFYIYEMEFLKIKLENYFIELEWKFKSQTLTKTLCISCTSLRSVEFEYQESFEMEGSLVQEIVRQFNCSELLFVFGERIRICSAEFPEGTFLETENHTKIRGTAFSVLRRNIKAATEGSFEKLEFLVDRDEQRLSICMQCDGIVVSHLTPIYIEDRVADAR